MTRTIRKTEEIHEQIELCDKLFAKFKKTRKHCYDVNYKEVRNRVQSVIKNEKKNFVVDKLTKSVGKPKELWGSLKGDSCHGRNHSHTRCKYL